MKPQRRVIVLVTRAANHRSVRPVAQWVRALVPAAVLVVARADVARSDTSEDGDAIVVDADALPSGPLSLADAIARAVAGAPAADG